MPLPACLAQLHKVLENESAQTMEAKAALEECHKEMERLRRELQVGEVSTQGSDLDDGIVSQCWGPGVLVFWSFSGFCHCL